MRYKGFFGSASNVGVKDSSTTLGMTLMFANVNVCVTLNEVEGSWNIYTPTFAKEPIMKRTAALPQSFKFLRKYVLHCNNDLRNPRQ